MSNSNIIELRVPFAEKDAAKALGAKWNPSKKTWYTFSNNRNLEKLNKWLNNSTIPTKKNFIPMPIEKVDPLLEPHKQTKYESDFFTRLKNIKKLEDDVKRRKGRGKVKYLTNNYKTSNSFKIPLYVPTYDIERVRKLGGMYNPTTNKYYIMSNVENMEAFRPWMSK